MTLDYLVKKYNIDLTQKFPIEIPNVGRLDLIRWFRELDYTKGAEIGVESGRYAELICQQNTQVKLYGIDPYLKYEEYHEYPNQEYMEGIYDHMYDTMAGYAKNGQFELIRKKSQDALADFEDGSLDFVYIDGNHEGDYPYQDIKGWAKKVRKNGIVAGHDFVRVKSLDFSIKDALKKYSEEENIKYFVLGRYGKKRGEVRDRTRSWMFIK